MSTKLMTFVIVAALIGWPSISTVVAATPVPAQASVCSLNPQNSKLQFVCAHVGPRPDPRKGGFAKFSGQARLDTAGKALKSVSLEIESGSLWTEIDMLTNHLKSADFFDVRRIPTAKFESTKIEPGSGKSQITGKLTLHGVTKEISFPATIEVSDAGLTLESEFTIDRSEFGMTYDPKKVENKVTLTVAIGENS